MPFQKGQNPNHSVAGSTIKVEPIRDKRAIARIKKVLGDHPRDLCLFTLGINTAYRANELLSIKVRQVRSLNVGDVLELKQSKTHKVSSRNPQRNGDLGTPDLARDQPTSGRR